MCISSKKLDMVKITREIELASHSCYANNCLQDRVIMADLFSGPYNTELVECASSLASKQKVNTKRETVLVQLYSLLSTPFLGLTEDDKDYVVDLMIPWGVIHGKLCVVDSEESALTPQLIVGDLSEGLLACSYNEDEIRSYWANGELNSLLQKRKVELQRVNLESHLPEDRDVQSLLTFFIKRWGSWPVHHEHRSPSLSTNLTDLELKMVEDFDDTAYVNRNAST